MQMTLHRFDLPLRHVFTTAHGSQNVYRALVVELEQDGRQGFGEAGESAYYGQSREAMADSLERLRPQIAWQNNWRFLRYAVLALIPVLVMLVIFLLVRLNAKG